MFQAQVLSFNNEGKSPPNLKNYLNSSKYFEEPNHIAVLRPLLQRTPMWSSDVIVLTPPPFYYTRYTYSSFDVIVHPLLFITSSFLVVYPFTSFILL